MGLFSAKVKAAEKGDFWGNYMEIWTSWTQVFQYTRLGNTVYHKQLYVFQLDGKYSYQIVTVSTSTARKYNKIRK